MKLEAMSIYLRTFLLLGSLVSSSFSDNKSSVNLDSTKEDCGEVQHNVDNGVIKLPDFSDEDIRNINCTWTYVASPGRKLQVKIDNVRLAPSEFRSSAFQLYVDDDLYDILQNCVKCLKDTVGGQTIRILYSSFLLPAHHVNSSDILTDDVGSFQVRYKSFDPYRCSKPEQIENGYAVSRGRKLGQIITYRCNPPYDLFGESEAECSLPSSSPLPEWSTSAPKCSIQKCTNGPVIRDTAAGAISSPGYPTYLHQFTAPCVWVVITQPRHQIRVSVTYLKLPNNDEDADDFSVLSLMDGDSQYLANLTDSLIDVPLNFTTVSNKLTIKFIVSNAEDEPRDEIGFYLEYTSITSLCPKPRAPPNGEVIYYSNDLGSIAAYRCEKGFALVGEMHTECIFNGQWNHPPPSCESPTIRSPTFVLASNDSDTVTAKFADLPIPGDSSPPKPSRNGKKKVKVFAKPTSSPDVAGRNKTLRADSVNERTGEVKIGKKYSKENGPKSEPHLFQVIPPKVGSKKSIESEGAVGRSPKNLNATRPDGQIQDLETDTEEEDKTSKRHPLLTVTMISIIAGVGAPLIVAIILLVVILLYRKRYPVRMRFGRKFSTFENPVYITKDAHHPRELKRLTT